MKDTSSPVDTSGALSAGGAGILRDRSQEEDARLNQESTKPPSAAIVTESEEGSLETPVRGDSSGGGSGSDNSDPTVKTPPGDGEDPECETKRAYDGKPPELLEVKREGEEDLKPKEGIEAEVMKGSLMGALRSKKHKIVHQTNGGSHDTVN